ncbi:MAG: hypothetical protein AB7P24_21640 [Nitrospira sp.]
MADRSFARINLDDLRRLGRIAAIDRDGLFRRNLDTARLFAPGPFAVALCQGAALHFLDGNNGVKDFDVWSFYRANPVRPFPYRRRGTADFGTPKFGLSSDSQQFVGRRVDLLGRSLPASSYVDPVAVLREYLREARTKTARCLAQKAVVLIEPDELIGTVVWPEPRLTTRSSGQPKAGLAA